MTSRPESGRHNFGAIFSLILLILASPYDRLFRGKVQLGTDWTSDPYQDELFPQYEVAGPAGQPWLIWGCWSGQEDWEQTRKVLLRVQFAGWNILQTYQYKGDTEVTQVSSIVHHKKDYCVTSSDEGQLKTCYAVKIVCFYSIFLIPLHSYGRKVVFNEHSQPHRFRLALTGWISMRARVVQRNLKQKEQSIKRVRT